MRRLILFLILCSYERRTQIRRENKFRMLESRIVRKYRLKREEEDGTGYDFKKDHNLYISSKLV
jgi:hypothetical protein